MGVRQRLNEGYLFGAVFWGAILGACFNSWTMFAVTTGILVALGMVGGSIRFSAVSRQRFARRRFAVRH